MAPARRKKRQPQDATSSEPSATAPTITGSGDDAMLVPPAKKAVTRGHKQASPGDDLVEPSSTGDLNAAPMLESQLPPKKCIKNK